MVEYDVLGNERHKAVCELRKLKCKSGLNGSFVCELASILNVPKDGAPYEDAVLHGLIRDRLIHLLGGDTPNISDLLKEDDDAVDARPSDSASADSPVHGAAGCGCGGACGCDGEELLAPITTELREYMEAYRPIEDAGHVVVSRIGTIGFEGFDRLCDNIDAIHAGLERENEELRKRTMYPSETERVNMLEREVKRLTSECKTQRNNFDQATSAREHWKTLYEQALEQIHGLERDYKVACEVNEHQDLEYVSLAKRYDNTITLPLDADGVPIRIGDVMEWPDGDDEPFEVVGIGENGTLFYMYDDSCEWTNAKNKVHHVPTVEDVLREMLDAWGELPSNATNEAIIAEYADKLKLADA